MLNYNIAFGLQVEPYAMQCGLHKTQGFLRGIVKTVFLGDGTVTSDGWQQARRLLTTTTCFLQNWIDVHISIKAFCLYFVQ